VRVKLQNGGAVEGDIFHQSLSIEENSLFEGTSRRVENPIDPSSSANATSPQKKEIQSSAADIDADLQRVESALTDWSESTVGPKH
jgi:cytoskeletal protein CcmA (bactofilin family)